MPELPVPASKDARKDAPFAFQVRLHCTRGEAAFNIPLHPDEYLTRLSIEFMNGRPLLIFPFTMTDNREYIRLEPHCPHCHGIDCEEFIE